MNKDFAAVFSRSRKDNAPRDESEITDGVVTEEASEVSLDKLFGLQVHRRLPDNVRHEEVIELSGHEHQKLFGVGAQPKRMDRMPGDPPLDLSDSPEATFAREARKQRLDGMLDKFRSIEKRKGEST